MGKYEIITIVINSIMALTSVISCIASLRSKKKTLLAKNKVEKIINNLKIEHNANNYDNYNDGINNGVMSRHISGGVKIESKK